jgi:two-component system chemotaxis response regulator CheB
VFAGYTAKSARDTVTALSLGASDFVLKPEGQPGSFEEAYLEIAKELVPKVGQFLPKAVKALEGPVGGGKNLDTFWPKAFVIASSTGGPRALETIFAGLKPTLKFPIFIAQHMPPIFTASLARRLTEVSGLQCKEAVHGEIAQANTVYIAPGDYHLTLIRKDRDVEICLDQGAKINGVRPAADNLFASAARVYGADCMAFVLTGMGQDGCAGAIKIHEAGGGVMLQDRASSVVWGMPGAIYEKGAFDAVGNLSDVAKTLFRMGKGQ